jgi:hypothetical protein
MQMGMLVFIRNDVVNDDNRLARADAVPGDFNIAGTSQI